MAMSTMNARQRMLAAMHHEPVDRIPTDIWATPEIIAKLNQHFGSGVNWMDILHIDGMAWTGARYIGPALPAVGENQTVDHWGIRNQKIDYGSGAYYEQYFWPLAHCKTIDDLRHYAWPQPDWWDYSQMRERALAVHDKQAVQCGYMAPFFYHNLLRGLEQSLMDPMEDAEFTHALLNMLSDSFYEYHRRMFAACEGLIDLSQVTDDLGTQTGPMISLETYREFYKPHHKRFIDLCHEFGILVMHHDDGAIRPFLPDLIELGIDILNPIQWRCPGMEVEGLKRDFGQKVCFHGAIDNQETLPHGTPEDVRAEVRHMIDVLASDGTGYVLAPCHCIQPVTKVENIIAMYEEAWAYGKR